MVGMLAIDVSNAFNSAPWNCILNSLRAMAVPEYLVDITTKYLSDRSVRYDNCGVTSEFAVRREVPQGSVLGPTLWNVLYNGLLKLALPRNVQLMAFADDVAIIATAEHGNFLHESLEPAFGQVNKWMDNGLTLSAHKTEAIVFTNRWSRNKMKVKCGGVTINSSNAIKYLGLTLDSKLNFIEHANVTYTKVSNTIKQLGYILPNLGGAKQWRRRLLGNVAISHILYGAPCWEAGMAKSAWSKLEKIQRRIALRIACAYSTVSYEAIAVVASIPPIRTKAKERTAIYNGGRAANEKVMMISRWQEEWTASTKGRWTYRLIPDVMTWFSRRHGDVDYHICQILTNHGCFNQYLKRIGKAGSDECAQCGISPDDAEHAVFVCDAWHRWRQEACVYLGIDYLTPENLISVMLRSKGNWQRTADLIRRIMRTREAEEHKRQQVPVQ